VASGSTSQTGGNAKFVEVCVYEDTFAGGQYVGQAIEAKNVPGGLPHAQSFEWGQNYLPDKGTVCAIPTEAPTATPTSTPTAVPTAVLAVVMTAVPTSVPTEVPTVMPPALTITESPTESPTPEATVEVPPAQVPPVQVPLD
jgi:hypothetical protein